MLRTTFVMEEPYGPPLPPELFRQVGESAGTDCYGPSLPPNFFKVIPHASSDPACGHATSDVSEWVEKNAETSSEDESSSTSRAVTPQPSENGDQSYGPPLPPEFTVQVRSLHKKNSDWTEEDSNISTTSTSASSSPTSSTSAARHHDSSPDWIERRSVSRSTASARVSLSVESRSEPAYGPVMPPGFTPLGTRTSGSVPPTSDLHEWVEKPASDTSSIDMEDDLSQTYGPPLPTEIARQQCKPATAQVREQTDDTEVWVEKVDSSSQSSSSSSSSGIADPQVSEGKSTDSDQPYGPEVPSRLMSETKEETWVEQPSLSTEDHCEWVEAAVIDSNVLSPSDGECTSDKSSDTEEASHQSSRPVSPGHPDKSGDSAQHCEEIHWIENRSLSSDNSSAVSESSSSPRSPEPHRSRARKVEKNSRYPSIDNDQSYGPSLPPDYGHESHRSASRSPPVEWVEFESSISDESSLSTMDEWHSGKQNGETTPMMDEDDTNNAGLSNDAYGPALPPGFTTGKAKQPTLDEERCYGPPLPPRRTSPDDMYGPTLPPGYGPAPAIGPAIPPTILKQKRRLVAEVEAASTDVIGPLLPGREIEEELRHWRDEPMSAAIAGGSTSAAATSGGITRDAWMTELMPSSQPDLIVGRRFRSGREVGTGAVADDSWLDVPGEKREGKPPNKKQRRGGDYLDEVVQRSIDRHNWEMAQEMEALNAMHGRQQSLLEIHEKKKNKKEKKEKEKKKKKKHSRSRSSSPVGPSRRAFDRDKDLELPRINPAARSAIIAQSRKMSSKFAHGTQHFL